MVNILSEEEAEAEEEILLDEEIEEEGIYGGEEDIDRFIHEEIKPLEKKDKKENRFRLLATLFFAIVGATVMGFFSPITAGEKANELYWWTPLIGAFIGAIIGAFLGLIVDAFYSATRKDSHEKDEKPSMDWSENKL